MVRNDLIELPAKSLLHTKYIRLMISKHAGHQRTTVVPIVDAVAFDRETDVVGHDLEGLSGCRADDTEEAEEEISH